MAVSQFALNSDFSDVYMGESNVRMLRGSVLKSTVEGPGSVQVHTSEFVQCIFLNQKGEHKRKDSS